MKRETWDLLQKEFERFPILRAEPTTEDEIREAEKRLRVRFSDDYRAFVLRYGGAIVGPYPILGLRRAEPMDAVLDSVVAATEYYREEDWPAVDGWYVFSIDLAGNPIGATPDGAVWVSDHDSANVLREANDFESFLLRRCLK